MADVGTGSTELVHVVDEIQWGLAYRKRKAQEKKPSIAPVPPPLELPELQCKMVSRASLTKKQKKKPEKLDLLSRFTLSKKKYIDFLATPKFITPIRLVPPKKKCRKVKPPFNACPPRIAELAIPKKPLAFACWTDYETVLTMDAIKNLDDILHADQCLEPEDARYHFTIMDRERAKQRRKKRKICLKKLRAKKKGAKKWICDQIKLTSKLIVQYFKNQPLFTLNYKQMLISDTILCTCVCKKMLKKKPNRATRNVYQRTIIDIADQIANWGDKVVRYVDLLSVDSEEEEPTEVEVEFEGEEFEGEQEIEWETELVEAEGLGSIKESLLTALLDQLEGIDEDLLALLIKICSGSTEEKFLKDVNADQLPGVLYEDVLEALKYLRDNWIEESIEDHKELMSVVLVDWVDENEPEQLTDRMRDKIDEVAGKLLFLVAQKRGLLKMFGYGEGEGEGEGEESDWQKLKTVTEESEREGLGYGEGEDDEAARLARLEAERLAREEAERLAREEAERLAREEAERLAREEAERLARLEAEQAASEASVDDMGRFKVPTMLPGHKPSFTLEHPANTLCCITLKVWAAWLLEVANNAHIWSKWLNSIINEVREIAAIIRGERRDENGQLKKYYKEDWKEFTEKVEKMIISWRQYSMHVKDLTDRIVENFHGKHVECCPACLQDNLIVDIVHAHDISQQLAEAMKTAGYWRRWLDSIILQTKRLCELELPEGEGAEGRTESESSSTTSSIIDLVEFPAGRYSFRDEEDDDDAGSFYDVESLHSANQQQWQ